MRYLFAAIAVACASMAQAQEGAAYYGLQLGEFDYSEEASGGFSAIGDTVSSYRLMIGYQFSDHLGVEGGWGKTGTIRDTAFVGFPPTAIGINTEFSSILIVRLLGVLPFDNGVRLLGGIGWADMKQKITVAIPGSPPQSGSNKGGEGTLFAGAQYDWERFAIRLGYEKYDLGGGVDVKETSLTFWYKL